MRKRTGWMLGVAVLALGFSIGAAVPAVHAQQEEQGEAEQEVDPLAEQQQAAQRFMAESDPDTRLQLVEEFLNNYPTSPFVYHAYLAACEAHRMKGDFESAVDYGKLALVVRPNDPISMLRIADALSEGVRVSGTGSEDKLAQAEEYARRSLEEMPQFFASVPRRPDVPEEEYTLREDFMEAQGHAILGYVYLLRNQNTQALNELKLATELNRLSPEPADYERLGIVQQEEKQYEEARASFQRCMELGDASDTCQRRLQRLEEIMPPQAEPGTEPPQEQ